MAPPFPLPPDVIQFVRRAFARCNARVSARLSHVPTVHETYLDLCLIETLTEVAAPHATPSGIVIDVDVHFLGSGRHWQSREIADIGLIVTYRRAGELVRTKIALLQSKRICPRESEFTEDEPVSKLGGFGYLHGPKSLRAQIPRTFHFDQTCRYRALQVGDNQWRAIASYEENFKIPVHYLLYHPKALPSSQTIPSWLVDRSGRPGRQ